MGRVNAITIVRNFPGTIERGTTMPPVCYVADRGTKPFETARLSVDLVCAGDSINELHERLGRNNRAHGALGYREAARLVFFRKDLG
jgi:hypothetical protein